MAPRRQPANDLPTPVDARPCAGVRVRQWDCPDDRAWPAGAHEGVEVAWIEGGRAEYRIGTARVSVEPGAAMIVPPEVEHATAMSARTRAGSLWIDRALFDEAADAVDRPAAALAAGTLARADRARALGGLLIAEAARPEAGQGLVVESLLGALMVEVLRGARAEAGPRRARDRRIRAAVELIEARHAEPLSLEALAGAASMSRFHFSRRFREETGKSPHQYLVTVRVRRAAALLERAGTSVSEAAFAVGFNDLGRFAAAFRRELGGPPSAWAARAPAVAV